MASVRGTHYLAMAGGSGDYEVSIQAHRPPLERESVPQVSSTFFGVGPDGVGGTADDTDTDLTVDTFRPLEEFTGTEDSINRTGFGLS